MSLVGSPRVAGGQTQPSSGSGVFFQGNGFSQAQINSNLSSSFGNSANSVSGKGCSNLYPTNVDMNRTGLNSASNSGPSVGGSSMITDANSALSGGPQLQRSASFNAESYMRMPASPMSFTSNNISVSGNSVLDVSSIVQQSSHQDQNSQQGQKRQHGASTASSRIGQVSLPTGSHVPNSSNLNAQYISQMQKKPRLDIKDEILHPQVRFHRQNSFQLHGQNPQMQALLQQPRHLQRQQLPQQVLQSVPPMQRAQWQQQMQQEQIRQQLHQQSLQSIKRPYETGACASRIMQYLFHQRQRPKNNDIGYWRRFTKEYFAPRAKKRWCLSLYENVGPHALGVFPQATMDAWHCEICGSKSGKGFEAAYEVIPRLIQVNFESGVKDEVMFLDLPHEGPLASGLFVLEYGKAVQESVYENLRVTREGRLRIIFSSEMKILSWVFCARKHEEFIPRRIIAPQMNQLMQVAHQCEIAVSESGSDRVSTPEIQANWNKFYQAGRQIAKSMELPLLNDLGFPKRYVRCLQIAEVVNSMKGLMDFSRERHIGPIESLKAYPRRTKLQTQVGQQGSAGGLPMHHGIGSQINSNNHMVGRGGMNTPTQTALNSYQSLLRQNSMNPTLNAPLQGGSSFTNPSPFRGTLSSSQGTVQSGPVNAMSNPHFQHLQLQQQQQQQQQAVNNNLGFQQNGPQSSSGNPSTHSDMIQQLLHDIMSNNSEESEQKPLVVQNANGPIGEVTSIPSNTATTGGLPVKTSTTDIGGTKAETGDSGVSNVSGDSNKGAAEGNSNIASVSADDDFNLDPLDFADVLPLPDIEGDISNAFPEWDM